MLKSQPWHPPLLQEGIGETMPLLADVPRLPLGGCHPHPHHALKMASPLPDTSPPPAMPGPPSFMFRPVRTRLLDSLAQSTDTPPKVVSVIAPVGYGKTVLMSQLHTQLQARGVHCFWIGLNERHASLERVLDALLALQASAPGTFEPTQALIRGDEPIARRIDTLIDTLAHLPSPTTLFIDNLNSCTDEALGQLLDALIFRTPAAVRFVWSSTFAPGFNAGRAKLEGLLRQVTATELSLDADETRELLGAELDGAIGAAGLATVQRRTEGWPAAVRMAQIILAGAERPAAALADFSGSDEDVAALLKRQVLSGFSPALQDFLLCLAQLHTFSAELCSHATGHADAQAHLDLLVQRNVFMVPLDRNGQRYRLHGLFREYLQSEARRHLSAERRQAVCQRAAAWCERAQEWHDAIDYALAAHDLPRVTRLLDAAAASYAREHGDIHQYIRWVEQLLAEGARIGWETHFWYVWALVFQRRYGYGLQQHQGLARRIEQPPEDDPPPDDFALRLHHLRMCIDLFTDRLTGASEGAEQFLSRSAQTSPLSYSAGSVGCIKAISLGSVFAFARARHALRTAQGILEDIGGDNTLGWVSLIDGALSTYEGDYAHAYRELNAGLARTRSRIGDDAVVCDTMALVAAQCAVEMGLKEEARHLLFTGLRSVQHHVLVDTAACGFEAAVKLWNGGAEELVSIPRLREVAKGHPPRLAMMLSCYLIQRLLCLGRLEDALAEARHAGWQPGQQPLQALARDELAIPRFRDLLAATQIELHLATRQLKQAEALIAHELPIAQDEGRAARLVELSLARLVIAMNQNQPAKAAKALTQAIGWAARRRIVRPFQDHAAVIANLVNDTKRGAWPFVLAEEQAFFAEVCSHLPTSVQPYAEWSGLSRVDSGPGVAPTQRETELLSLMDLGLWNQQMAEASALSITTIKWHQKNLYRKLEVTSRAAAIARARALGLLAHRQ